MQRPSQPFTTDQAYQWAASRCALGEHCRGDISQKLRQRGLSSADCDAVCDRLEDAGFINEERYTRAFVHDKLLFDGWGRIKITQALRLNGISASLIRDVLADLVDDEAYEARLRTLIERKAATLPPSDDPRQRTQRLVRFAAARGYEPELIFRVVDD